MPRLFFQSSRFNPFAVVGTGTLGAKGVAPNVGQDETDPDWQPM
jgi:hypothetical protein